MLILKKAHRYFYLGIVVLFFILLFPLLFFYSRKVSRFKSLNHVRRFYSYISSWVTGIFYRYTILIPIDWSRTYIICSNHTSNLDIPATTIAVKTNFAFIGKDELLRNPLLKIFFKTIDIALNRESKISAFKAFKRGEEYLKQGISLVIFPEGTRAAIGAAKRYKLGGAALAAAAGAPVVPVAHNAGEFWQRNAFVKKPGNITVSIGPVIETAGRTPEEVNAQAEAWIEGEMRRLFPHHYTGQVAAPKSVVVEAGGI